MLTPPVILVVLLAIATYALISRKLASSILSLPMVFTGFGLLLGQIGAQIVSMETGRQEVHLITEITLILVLFADASRVNLASLRSSIAIPERMLLIGMPLSILFGTIIARWVSPDQPWALAFLLSAILTPTDAALGQSVVTSPAVPKRISQSINVESGLNDGIALPIVLIAAIMSAATSGAQGEGVPENIALFTCLQLILGPVAGIVVGYLSAKLLDLAVSRKTVTMAEQGLYFLATAFIAYYSAELIGGNGFIAAFVGGLTFGNTLPAPPMFINEFMESEGQLLTMLTFLVFGSLLAPIGLTHASWRTLTLAISFLSVVRVAAIWLALIGMKLSSYEKLFLGWFGPRGLASILFVLLVLEEFPIPGEDELIACVVLTVLFSIVLHGVSAVPLSNLFSRKSAR
ncbi:transporter, CPA2 family [Synechococcus sp. PCC 7335]|uniref:cation:proton antiporter n=1 Tax=Synechococcus sp. (strain ATCC 29403 / PCC 7335) TaxID=91464 RepID=UPI00017EE7D9|nr:cation:proton antiporter [Synechococcus sp. PCC 7335]EDX85838.1 transporter, CPA2 family [Synechococcus sp. PCC 7335]